ncbi:SDR family NAD(P)-dependent oxidoreductase [Mycobacterium sp. smrl_JER01]|uniref:SDR family NAD(P)-dependent oxidoreductase n=1 Tax=Mycobacterium sp. smrl_JER01 TaxID=3402633 RepID=UPI003AD7276B
MDVNGAHVLVTGASGGIGHALAAEFAARGARLTLTGRRAEVLDEMAARLGAAVYVGDLSDRDEVSRMLARVEAVDVLIANAGVPASGLLDGYSVAQIDRALDVNLRAPIVMAKVLGEQMAARGSGHLVFMSSLSGKSASGHMALYNATKFGLRGFALALREDLRAHGVGVSTIFPGPVRDAGMIADTDVKVPRVGTRTSHQVARATVKAVEDNLAEVTVAPWPLRVNTMLGGLLPEFTAAVARRTGGNRILEALGDAQAAKR